MTGLSVCSIGVFDSLCIYMYLCVVCHIDHGMKEVLVNVEQSRIKKPFLGGYRHKETGIEYHHASSQTLPKRRPDNDVSEEMCRRYKMGGHVYLLVRLDSTDVCFVL